MAPSPKTITVKSDFRITNIEELLKTICQQENQILHWPTNLKQTPVGGEPLAVICLATWASQSPNRRIGLYLTDDGSYHDFLRTLHGLSVGLSYKSAYHIHQHQEINLLLRSRAIALLKKRSQQEYSANLILRLDRTALHSEENIQDDIPHGDAIESMKGQTFLALCADHFGLGTPHDLYDELSPQEFVVKSANGFEALSRKIVKAVSPADTKSILTPDFTEAVGGILRELVLNTHQYAKTDINDSDLDISLRGVFARLHHLDMQRMGVISERVAPLALYFRNLIFAAGGNNERKLLEISVFDSGPGYASRLLKKTLSELSPEAEHQAVIDCFTKHRSSKKSPHRGNGLSLVVDLLRKMHGFLQIRTGRVSLYVDPNDAQSRSSLELRPIFSEDPSILPLAPAQGVCVSILLPIGLKARSNVDDILA